MLSKTARIQTYISLDNNNDFAHFGLKTPHTYLSNAVDLRMGLRQSELKKGAGWGESAPAGLPQGSGGHTGEQAAVGGDEARGEEEDEGTHRRGGGGSGVGESPAPRPRPRRDDFVRRGDGTFAASQLDECPRSHHTVKWATELHCC